MMCRDCKKGQYLIYDSDETRTSRCGQCGELEKDQVETPKPKPAVKRAPVRVKEKP